MRLELHKLLVRGVIVERDDSGRAVAERETDPVNVFSVEEMAAYYEKLRVEVEAMNETIAEVEAAETNGHRGVEPPTPVK